jgi:hypothetical protein
MGAEKDRRAASAAWAIDVLHSPVEAAMRRARSGWREHTDPQRWPGAASARRAAEFDISHTVGHLSWRQYHVESCKNVYYRLNVARADGRKGNVGDLRKMLSTLQRVNA